MICHFVIILISTVILMYISSKVEFQVISEQCKPVLDVMRLNLSRETSYPSLPLLDGLRECYRL